MEGSTITCSASACSKVLLTGAYLIIDPLYSGLVLGTDARFYTRCQLIDNKSDTNFKIIVTSKQFNLKNEFVFNEEKGLSPSSSSHDIINPFIHKCVYHLTQFVNLPSKTLLINLSGDNAFYS
jgi:phosphomevalonate kinase